MCFQTFPTLYMMIWKFIQWKCVMKSYDELKAEMEAIQQQMIQAKMNKRTDALNEVRKNG